VRGIKLRPDDVVVGMETLTPESAILTVTENGFGKRTKVGQYRLQTRGGSGIINIKTSQRNGAVCGILSVVDTDEVMLIAQSGKIIRMKVDGISVIGRSTQGVKLLNITDEDRVVALARLAERAEGDEDGDDPGEE
jgi:DNA gyrase subunit A